MISNNSKNGLPFFVVLVQVDEDCARAVQKREGEEDGEEEDEMDEEEERSDGDDKD